MEAATTKIYGDVSPDALSALDNLRAQSRDLIYQLGQQELEKAMILAHIQNVENRAQGILMDEGKKLEIPEGVPWKVANGKAVSIEIADFVNQEE